MGYKYVIKETDDYYPLSVLINSSGLGIDIQHDNPPGIIKMWRLEEEQSGELAGTVILQLRDGVPCLGGLAIDERYRNDGCGSMLQNHLFEQAKLMGYSEVWTCARIPDYYKRFGWEEMDWDTSPAVAIWCSTCKKYQQSCFPKKLRRKL